MGLAVSPFTIHHSHGQRLATAQYQSYSGLAMGVNNYWLL
jgi:hypothetical protein